MQIFGTTCSLTYKTNFKVDVFVIQNEIQFLYPKVLILDWNDSLEKITFSGQSARTLPILLILLLLAYLSA